MPIDLYIEVQGCPDGLEAFLTDVADTCLNIEGVERCGFTIRVVDDETIREINCQQRNIDSATDVLSFPTVAFPAGKYASDVPRLLKREYDPSLGFNNLGDCILNIDRARVQAKEFGHSLRRELGYLTAHSAFHLMGYDHMVETDKRLMRAKEKSAMEQLELFRNQEREKME